MSQQFVFQTQGSQTLVHKLHDKQLELLLAFLAIPMKDTTQVSPRALVEMLPESNVASRSFMVREWKSSFSLMNEIIDFRSGNI